MVLILEHWSEDRPDSSIRVSCILNKVANRPVLQSPQELKMGLSKCYLEKYAKITICSKSYENCKTLHWSILVNGITSEINVT